MGGRALPIRRGVVALVSLVLASFFLLGLEAQAATRFRDFPIPTASTYPHGIAAGPDGKLWFAEYYSDKLGRITTAGVITEFPIPTASSLPYQITAGPDGNLWFTEGYGNMIGRITTAGAIRESGSKAASGPDGIAAGPDGNIWFTENTGNAIAEFRIP